MSFDGNNTNGEIRARIPDFSTTLENSDNDDDDENSTRRPSIPPSRGASPRSNHHDQYDNESLPPTPVAPRSPSQPETPLTPLSSTSDQNDQEMNDGLSQEGPVEPPENNDNNENDDELEDNNNHLSSAEGADTVIRGTDVNVHTVVNVFTEFLRHFRSLEQARRSNRRRTDNNDNDDDNDSIGDDSSLLSENEPPPLYLSKLEALASPSSNDYVNMPHAGRNNSAASLELDARHLYFHNQACQRLYHQLTAYPAELIPLFDSCCEKEVANLGNHNLSIQVRPYNLRNVSHLRTLDPIHMDSLVGVQGMIVRTSPILPDLRVAHFSCTLCGHNMQVAVDAGRIAEPSGKCPGCNANASSSFQLVHNRSVYADKQCVRLQETPDQVPAGHTPASCLLFAFDDLCDQVVPGDRVEVTAILRAQPVRTHPKLSKMRTLYKTYLDVVHYRKITGMGTNCHSHSQDGPKWSPERITQLQELSRQPDIYQKLVQSLAPSIWELDDMKKGVLCQLFGGNSGYTQEDNTSEDSWLDGDDHDELGNGRHPKISSKTHKRGDINILLCGDPGTSKSQLLSAVNKMSQRGVYTSGKGSSAVGLTASVVRDPETRDLVLESGALVLSDLGICCIDEL